MESFGGYWNMRTTYTVFIGSIWSVATLNNRPLDSSASFIIVVVVVTVITCVRMQRSGRQCMLRPTVGRRSVYWLSCRLEAMWTLRIPNGCLHCTMPLLGVTLPPSKNCSGTMLISWPATKAGWLRSIWPPWTTTSSVLVRVINLNSFMLGKGSLL